MTVEMSFSVTLPWLKSWFRHLAAVTALKAYLNSLNLNFVGLQKIRMTIMVLNAVGLKEVIYVMNYHSVWQRESTQ